MLLLVARSCFVLSIPSSLLPSLPPPPLSVAFEDVVVVVPFPKAVKTTHLQANVGTVLYDEASKVGREGGKDI